MGRLAIANKQFFIVGLQVLSFCLQASCVLTHEKIKSWTLGQEQDKANALIQVSY